MFRALVIKELREIWWMGLLALGLMVHAVGQEMGWEAVLFTGGEARLQKMPYLDRSIALKALLYGAILGAALGLWQTFRESQSRTWHFLLFRPVERRVILQAKMSSAAIVYMIAVILPLTWLMVWAAWPGTHPSPYHWTLTLPAWYGGAAGSGIYVASMFAGLRQGRMFGTRWWPLISAGVIFILLSCSLPVGVLSWLGGLLVLWDLLLLAAVQDELNCADFG